VISFPRRHDSTLGDFQKVALHGFHNNPKFDLREHVTFSTTEVVEAYFGLFGILFFGTLKDCCALSIDGDEAQRGGEMIEKELKRKNVLGFLSRGQEEKCVAVVSSQPDEFEGRYEKMKAYVAMLLHVMIHALQGFGRVGIRVVGMGLRSWGENGMGGCGRMLRLRQEAVRDGGFLNLDLRLEREFAVVVAMKGCVKRRIWSDGPCDLRL
jgi:hypothetical protein